MSCNRKTILLIPVLAFTGLILCSCDDGTSGKPAASDVEILFNGKDLTGWKGDPRNWKVEDGVIVGTTDADKPLPYNQFLIYQGKPVEDFELTADMKLTSNGNNSGIQYRSKERPDLGEYVMSGYQCDMHPSIDYNGMLYEEKGRGIICKRGQKVVITPAGKPKVVGRLGQDPEFKLDQWNTYTILAEGNHLIHKINGVKTVDLFDQDEGKRAMKGAIAFQIHRGPGMKVEIRNVRLKRLPKSVVTPPEATPVPANAPDVNPPKKKKKAGPKPKAAGKASAKQG